jgi:hypothetical protein
LAALITLKAANMPDTGPIEQLEALDTSIQAMLARQPGVFDLLRSRLLDQFPQLPTALDIRQVQVEGRSLEHLIEGRWLTGSTPEYAQPSVSLSYSTHGQQQTPLLVDGQQLARFIDIFCSQFKRLYYDTLPRFWLAHREQGSPVRQWLRQQRIEQLRLEASLRNLDDTLSTPAKALLQKLFDYPDEASRAALANDTQPVVCQLQLQNLETGRALSLPGVFVAQARNGQGPALIRTQAFGLEEFSSLQQLHLELAERLDDERQGLALLQLFSRAEREWLGEPDNLLFKPLVSDIFARGVEDIINWQKTHVDQALGELLNTPAHPSLQTLNDHLRRAADVAPYVSRHALLRTRYAKLLEKHMPAWLRNASHQAISLIMLSLQELATALELAADRKLPGIAQFGERAALRAYAREQLRNRIASDHSLRVDPDRITINVVRAVPSGPVMLPTNPNSSIAVRLQEQAGATLPLLPRTVTLSEQALENIGALDVNYWLTATIGFADGRRYPAITPAYIKQIVRELDIGGGYYRHLEQRLLHSPEAAWRQEHYRRITLARMHAEAIKARFAGHFSPDRQERGYRWAQAVLQQPDRGAGRPLLDGHVIEVQQLLLEGATVRGVLIVAPPTPDSVPSLLVYTPHAPDRKAWREFANRSEMFATFQNDAKLREYLAQRVSAHAAPALRRKLGKQPFGALVRLATITGDFVSQSYQAEVRQALAETRVHATSTAQINRETLWDAGLTALELVSMALPSKVLLPLTLSHAMWAFWDGLEALHREQRLAALEHFMHSLSRLTQAGYAVSGSPVFAKALRKIPVKAPSPLPPSLRSKGELAHLRYRVDSIYREGVYEQISEHEGPAQYYMEDKAGRRYQVLFDGERWHVVDARNSQAYFNPLVRRNAQGELEVIDDVRWLGVTPDLPKLLNEFQVQGIDHVQLQPDGLGIASHAGSSYLVLGKRLLLMRKSLLANRYRLVSPPHRPNPVSASVLLRHETQPHGWQVKVKQRGVASVWLPAPL